MLKSLWILSLAMPALLLGSTPISPQAQTLPLPDCSQASSAPHQPNGIIDVYTSLPSPHPYELYAWVLLNPAGCPTGVPAIKLPASAPRLQDMAMRRIWFGASRALKTNSARVPGSAQRLEAHNLTVESMHRFAALPVPLPADSPAAETVLTQLERSLALDPELATAYWLKASVEAELGRQEAALADFERALALPNHPLDTGFGLATLLSESNQRQAAIYAYEDLMKEAGVLLDAPADLSQATLAQWEEIAISPSDALPTLAATYLGRGDIYQTFGRCELAEADFEIACKLGLAAGCERVCKN